MLENQVKNTIKLVVAAILVAVFGEGVFSLGLYWPFIFLLLDWDGVFWLVFGIGMLISVFNGLAIGLPSLLLVIIFGVFSFVFGGRRDLTLLIIIALVIANFVFDKLLGLRFSFLELLVTAGFYVLVLGWGEKSESIHIRYK